MIGIMKDCAFHWRFNDTENKLKASTLAVRVLRDTRQIFPQCSKKKKTKKKQDSWTSTVPQFSGVLCCLFKRRSCTMTQMGHLMRCSPNERLSFLKPSK